MYSPFLIESPVKEEIVKSTVGEGEDMRKYYTENIPRPSEKVEAVMMIVKCISKELHAQLNIPRTNNKISKMKYTEFEQIWTGFLSHSTDAQLSKFTVLRAEKRLSSTVEGPNSI